MVEGRRPVGGKASRDACPGPSAETGMSPRRRACGPGRKGPPKPPRPGRVRPPTGARCGKAARRDLRGGRAVRPVPTATVRLWGGPDMILDSCSVRGELTDPNPTDHGERGTECHLATT